MVGGGYTIAGLNCLYLYKTRTMAKSGIQTKAIPEFLIYEMDGGRPIYYRGYQEVLNNTKTPEEVMGSSILQSLLIELIKDLLKPLLGKEYAILASELGIQFAKKSWRNVDIAVFRKRDLLRKGIKDKYSEIPPLLAIEIDTKASLEDFSHPEQYFHTKTDQLLDFGVGQVLWIFTASEKFMIAEKGKRWETGNWEEDLALHFGIQLNIRRLLDEFVEE